MNFQELISRLTELDQSTYERATGGQPTAPGTNRLTGEPNAPSAVEPDHLAEPPERAPAAPGAPNAFANKTRMPDPAAAARAQRSAAANDLANQQQPKEGNAFSGALDAARDSGQSEFEVDGKKYKVHEDGSVEECGMPGMADMPNGMMGMRNEPPKQSDSVNMNISLNAAGGGGIRDLMDILRNIDSGGMDHGHDHDMDPELIVKKMSAPDQSMDKFMGAEDFANEPDEMYSDINYNAGGDLNRPKGAYAMAHAGDNAMAVESIRRDLEKKYQQIKENTVATWGAEQGKQFKVDDNAKALAYKMAETNPEFKKKFLEIEAKAREDFKKSDPKLADFSYRSDIKFLLSQYGIDPKTVDAKTFDPTSYAKPGKPKM
jgi:hypothetical protein